MRDGWLPKPSCQCPLCSKDFSSLEAFTRHKQGSHDYLFAEGLRMNPPREDGRRCLDTDEMQARGYAQDAKGRWGQPARQARASKAFHGVTPTPKGAE